MKTEKRTVYVAFDGTEFNDENECLDYERNSTEFKVEELDVKALADKISRMIEEADCHLETEDFGVYLCSNKFKPIYEEIDAYVK